MKNKKNWLGMLVLLLVFGMSVVGCSLFDNNNDDDPKGGNNSNNNNTDYNMTGTYTFTKTGGNCTWVFAADKTYQCSGYGIFRTETGTWKSKGNDVTISYKGSDPFVSEDVFTVQANGNQVTLTIKDSSIQLSNLLVQFGLTAKSVTLTKMDTDGSGNIVVTLNGLIADGSASQSTTKLTLNFSQAITNLSASDITISGISGVTKGYLSSETTTYSLDIYGFKTGGTLTVAVAKPGFNISGTPKTVTIYYYYYSGVSPGTIEMASIPDGTFIMGSPTSEPNRGDNETQHSVTLSGFNMSKYQVTQEQYQAVMGNNPSSFSSNPQTGEAQGKRPVERVSWYDAIVFCNKLSILEGLSPAYSISDKTNPAEWGTVPTSDDVTWNAVIIVSGSTGYRLPTEAQWEYACRAGTATAYNTGDTISDSTGWYSDNSGSQTHEVGKKSANAWGLYDMHGNVWEWCYDWLWRYGGLDGRVARGGSWGSSAGSLRSASCGGSDPNRRYVNVGFRLVRP